MTFGQSCAGGAQIKSGESGDLALGHAAGAEPKHIADLAHG
jgi:hypothetical protein